MKLDDLGRNWHDLGKVDPLWAILAAPNGKGNQWDIDEFFRTGLDEVDGYFALLDELDVSLPGAERALDFGCGVGRLTQALTRNFDQVDGVDIAPSMIALACDYNVKTSGTRFHLNDVADLLLFADDSFDFVISIVVLQHMNNSLKGSYLKEFFRVLRPGGVAMFTVPSHANFSTSGLARRLPNSALNIYRRRRHGYKSVMEFYAMRQPEVEAAIAGSGAVLRAAVDDPMAGPPWHSRLYVVQKPIEPAPRRGAGDES